MKLKISVDQAAVKTFFLDHVEKIVFGAIVLCFGLIVYEAVGRETFEKQPDDLIDSAVRAEEHWKTGKLNPPVVEHRNYTEIAKNNSRPIPFEPYRWRREIRPPLRPHKDRRGIPPLLNVRELRAVGGRVALNLPPQRAAKDPALARGGPRGFRYAVLTGLIPKKDQERLYDDYFMERVEYNPERDVPQYLWYAVERAEVRGTEAPAEADFARLDLNRAVAIGQLWTARGMARTQAVVDQKYLHPRLSFPLPPRVSGSWGEEVAHPDEIPLPSPERRGLGEGEYMGVPAAEGPGIPGVPEIPGGAEIPGIPEGVAIPRLPGEEEPVRTPESTRMEPREPEYLLFRFFDFTVEPGKKYRYRVKLWLVNPNYGMDPRFLEDTTLSKLKYVEPEKWSEPTNVVETPMDSEVLLLAVKAPPPTRVADEPSANLGIVQWVSKSGATVYEDFETVRRGGVLDFTGYEFPGGKIVEEEEKPQPRAEDKDRRPPRRGDDDRRPKRGGPRRGSGEEGYMGEEFMGEPIAAPRPVGRRSGLSKAVPVDYLTGAIVLDIRGGERISQQSSDRRPGDLLLLGGDGSLHIHHELEDSETYEQRKLDIEGRPEGREGAFPGPGMMEPGMEMIPPEGEWEHGFEGAPGFEWER